MNGYHQNRKGRDLQKPIPSCMGRMINIFDLGAGMPKTKLLTEKPHHDVPPIQIGLPDVPKKKSMDNFGVQVDKMISGRKHSNKKYTGTPVKMLIAQEMLRQPQSKQKPSNVVAKLMGLEMLPAQQSAPNARTQEGYSCKSVSADFQGYHQQDETRYKDVREVWQQPPVSTCLRDKPQGNRRYDENSIEKRMALVHQKFTEVKRLATDERLLQSKEFQEALEVLSSNRDLFLKFLEGPNALFSKHHSNPETISSTSHVRRITVLKPSKMTEPKVEAQERKLLYPDITKDIDPDIDMSKKIPRSSNFVHQTAESISEPTRIVVLKPNPGISQETGAGVASIVTSSIPLEGKEYHGSLGPDDAAEPREIAKEITRQMQGQICSNQTDETLLSSATDETLLSSALSSGYVGDESSFNTSEIDYIKEECDNASDLESVTATSQQSLDYGCRLGSPFSVSSSSQASNLHEPSVIKEAKKRLSERLAMVSSNGNNQDQCQMQRSSSTLGEVLSIAEVKKEVSDNLFVCSKRSYAVEQDQRPFVACLSIGVIGEGCSEDSPRNLGRSKSVPISSSVYENIELSEGVPLSRSNKPIVPKEVVTRSKSGMSFFKGKFSSLLLSKIKKVGMEKPIPSCFVGLDHTHASRKRNDASAESPHPCPSENGISVNPDQKSGKFSSSTSLNGPKQDSSIPKACLSFEKSRAFESFRESQDQPSPISVLEAPFEDDASSSICQPSASIISGHPQALGRSPPIGSISRTLTSENPRGGPLRNSSKLFRVLSRECEEQERSLLVQKLLSCTNLSENAECSTVLAGWHSLKSPMDPLLLDDFLDTKGNEAKCSERRSNQRLLFDCVNAALLLIGQTALLSSYPWATTYGYASKSQHSVVPVADEVLRLVKSWFSCKEGQISGEAENRNLLVEKLVKSEITGKIWAEWTLLELDEFSREIGEKLLEELIEEALADITDGCL